MFAFNLSNRARWRMPFGHSIIAIAKPAASPGG